MSECIRCGRDIPKSRQNQGLITCCEECRDELIQDCLDSQELDTPIDDDINFTFIDNQELKGLLC